MIYFSIRILLSIIDFILFNIRCSRIFEVIGMNEIGQYDLTSFGGFSGFATIIATATFQAK